MTGVAERDRIILAYDPFQGDETDVCDLSDKMVVTRKPHRCQNCWRDLPSGERCRAKTERNDEDHVIMTFYFCPECCTAMFETVSSINWEAVDDRYMLHQVKEPSP